MKINYYNEHMREIDESQVSDAIGQFVTNFYPALMQIEAYEPHVMIADAQNNTTDKLVYFLKVQPHEYDTDSTSFPYDAKSVSMELINVIPSAMIFIPVKGVEFQHGATIFHVEDAVQIVTKAEQELYGKKEEKQEEETPVVDPNSDQYDPFA